VSDDRDVILVIGPALSGATSVANALRQRLGGYRVVECLGPGERPAAVVFVVSAAAPITQSQIALLDAAAASTDALVAAVAKIDVHRGWPQVLEENRALAAPPALSWVGVAADPHIGPSKLEPLLDALDSTLRRRSRHPRNWLLPNNSHAQSRISEREGPATARAQRAAAVRQLRVARVQLTGRARASCASMRADLRRDVAGLSRRGVDEFCSGVRRRSARAVAELDATLSLLVDDLDIAGIDIPWIDTPGIDTPGIDGAPESCPALETYLPRFGRVGADRVTALLSVGFGLGMALTLGRLLADLAPTWTAAIMAASLLTGIGLSGWVIRARGLVAERAALDRWATEVTAGLRTAMEERVVMQMLAVETAIAAEATAGRNAGCRIRPRDDRP
jgi:hypothetical protein